MVEDNSCPVTRRGVLALGDPQVLSPKEVVPVFEEFSGRWPGVPLVPGKPL
jgi:hypothetical protein